MALNFPHFLHLCQRDTGANIVRRVLVAIIKVKGRQQRDLVGPICALVCYREPLGRLSVVEQKEEIKTKLLSCWTKGVNCRLSLVLPFSSPLFPIVLYCKAQSIIAFHTCNVSTTSNFFSFESIPLKMMRKWPPKFLSSQVLRSIIFGGGFSNSQQLATRF
jgi:hypothetical protein